MLQTFLEEEFILEVLMIKILVSEVFRLRALLKENDVKFGPRTSLEKLRELAGELN